MSVLSVEVVGFLDGGARVPGVCGGRASVEPLFHRLRRATARADVGRVVGAGDGVQVRHRLSAAGAGCVGHYLVLWGSNKVD